MKASNSEGNQSLGWSFAGWGKRLSEKPQPPTLRNFVLGFIALFLVMVGMAQLRSDGRLDAAILVGGGLALWLWRMGRVDARRLPLIGQMFLSLPRWWLGGVLALIAVGVAIWEWRSLDVLQTTDDDWLWYLAGIAILVVAAAVMERWNVRNWHIPRQHGAFWAILAIVALAGITRFIFLGSLPFGTWYDEAANGLESLRVLNEPAYRPIYTDGVNSTGHYLWLIVAAFKLFGENTLAVRSISAVMGIATVLFAYWAGRELHSSTLGVIWAATFAIARWSITFSRLGMYNSATPLFQLLTLFWLLRGLRRGSVLDFTLAGLSIGLGLCFYSAFQLFLAVIIVLVLVIAWQERARWPTLAGGLAITTLAALIVIAPVAKYALEKPESYFSRVEATSLFAGKTPEERLPALWENTRKHLLMFNISGDPNGRHNLAGEPELDWVMGGLFIVGLAICLRRGFAPRYLIIPVWIAVGLAGGIFSLDFEAPQSLRAIGALPAVLLCAALPVTLLVDEWRMGAGRYFPDFGLWVVAFAFFVPAAYQNLDIYFVKQAHDFASWNAHSTPETIVASILRDADPAVDKFVVSLFDGHPTVRFLAKGVAYHRIETTANLPILRDLPNGMILLLDAERSDLYQETRRLYPNAAFQEIRPPNGGPVVVYENQLTRQDVQSIQGLNGVYTSGNGVSSPQTRRDLMIDFNWPQDAPVSLPFMAEWQGVLAVNTYGPYQFFVQAPSKATLWIDESVVITGDGSHAQGLGGGLMLASGHHAIRLRAEGGTGSVRLAWQSPDGPPQTIPSWALYVAPVQSNGLLGRYFANGDWSGEPALAQIDPRLNMYFHVPVLPRPYTVEWSGKIAIPAAGQYDFGLQSIDDSMLAIDGQTIIGNHERNAMGQGGLLLDAGLHDILIRYGDRTDHTYITLTWRPPGMDGALHEIPSDMLFPPQGNYTQVHVADLARFMQSNNEPKSVESPAHLDPAQANVIAAGLVQPHGVAVSNGVVYVAETGNKRVKAYDATSGKEVASPFESINFQEPFDIAAQADGSLVVLDAGSGQLLRYDPVAGVVSAIPVSPDYVSRSRGIGAGIAGEIWIANTPGQRVVAIDDSGAILQSVALPSTSADVQEMQPTDVAAMPDNTLFVADVSGNMLYHFNVAGYLLSSQPIPIANSIDSTHLVADGSGSFYMTEPEPGLVLKLDGGGTVEHVWNVRSAQAPDAKPIGITVASDGTIWVADSQGGRLIQVIPEATR